MRLSSPARAGSHISSESPHATYAQIMHARTCAHAQKKEGEKEKKTSHQKRPRQPPSISFQPFLSQISWLTEAAVGASLATSS